MLTDGGDLAKLADFGLALELKSGRCESTAEVCMSFEFLIIMLKMIIIKVWDSAVLFTGDGERSALCLPL